MDTDYGIFEYEVNIFCTYISYQTGTSLSDVKKKRQITYIDNYLKGIAKEKKLFFVFENEYIDKHYLEDFSSYYVKCFKEYKKTCSRVHFFTSENNKVDYKKEFKQALNGQITFINQKNYLGFLVIRPIPKTFLAKVCLKSYYNDNEHDRLKKYILSTSYKVSLFGIDLEINSIAFQEQDKILSACATTAIWSFLYAHPKMANLHVPSASLITKSAYPEQNGFNREFPNFGLTTEMICRSLRSYNLIPEYFDFSDGRKKRFYIFSKDKSKKIKLDLLREYIFAYCSSGLPQILGVSVEDAKTKEYKGLHAITILGYSFDNTKQSKLKAHNLNAIYAHDDRIGPYLKITLEKNNFQIKLYENNTVTSNHHFDDEILTFDTLTLIMGLYHKIRIPYILIKNTCLTLEKLLKEYLNAKELKNIAHSINSLISWDIHLKYNNNLKNDILNGNIKNKEQYLTKSWPKYIWSSTAFFLDKPIFEILFDATDIEQGNVFLDILPLEEKHPILEILLKYCKESFQNIKDQQFDNKDNTLILSIIKHFGKKETYSESLNYLFGYLKIPKYIKSTELSNDSIINQCEIRTNREDTNNKLDKNLKKTCQYIWVIDEEGFLCIGKEYQNNSKGHPTLTDGMPARIGGELSFDSKQSLWIVNYFSGRYSSEYLEEEKRFFVENAIKYKFNVFFPKDKFFVYK